MNKWLLVWALALSTPAFGQKIYKCPGPDGKEIYQQKRCPDGGRFYVQDNGKVSGDPPAPPSFSQGRSNPMPAADNSGLRSGEKEMLRDIQVRDELAKRRAIERDRVEAIREHGQKVDNLRNQMHQDHETRMEVIRQHSLHR